MVQLSKRLILIGSITVIVGALIKILHILPLGDYLLFSGFFISGVSGVLEYIYSSERNFNSYAKLIASALMCLAIIIDLAFGTNLFNFAVIFLAISFFSSALPGQKIPK